MRFQVLAALLAGIVSTGCSVLLPVVGAATYPLDKRGSFEEAQADYTNDVRFGLWDDAKEHVEPDLRPQFEEAIGRLREVRFSDSRTTSIDLDPLKANATARVTFRGYWLSSPYEREVEAVQRWRREVPTQNWYVTPDFEALLGPAIPPISSAIPSEGH
ncbi:MAG: hypothetical protein ACQGVC_23875 [Myxococcota bacterium]